MNFIIGDVFFDWSENSSNGSLMTDQLESIRLSPVYQRILLWAWTALTVSLSRNLFCFFLIFHTFIWYCKCTVLSFKFYIFLIELSYFLKKTMVWFYINSLLEFKHLKKGLVYVGRLGGTAPSGLRCEWCIHESLAL